MLKYILIMLIFNFSLIFSKTFKEPLSFNDSLYKLKPISEIESIITNIPNVDFNQYLSLIDNSKIYVTLAAVTGSSYQKQEVLYWDWCSEFDPVSSILQETETTEINIYPNPSSDILHINGILSNQTIEMYDITGRLLISQKYDKNIDVSNFNRGIYMIKVDNQFYKFIKN